MVLPYTNMNLPWVYTCSPSWTRLPPPSPYQVFFKGTTVRLSHPFRFPGGSEVKASACNVGDLGSIPGSGRSPGEGNGNPPQYSCLENPMDVEAWWATVHGVAKSWIRLSDFTFTFTVKFAQTFVYRDHYIYCFEEQKNLPSALRRNRFSASQVCFLYILKR